MVFLIIYYNFRRIWLGHWQSLDGRFLMRVPLISPVTAVIYRLDIEATWDVDPAGALTEGFDYLLREPVIEHTDGGGGTRTSTRQEMAAVSVPCQYEVQSFERLNATFPGNDAVTENVLVLHRKDLAALSLLDATTNKCLFKPGDRIDHLEKNGTTILVFDKPLYVYQVMPRSWGFGPTGYDLELLYTSFRSSVT